MRRAALLLLATAADTVSAQTPTPPAPGTPPGRFVTYICAGGQDFTARFSEDNELATLAVPGQPDVELSRQTSGSGFAYGDSYYELRGRGREATLAVRGGGAMRCHAVGKPGEPTRSYAAGAATLTLMSDGVFRLRDRRDGSASLLDHGLWSEEVDGGLRLILRGEAVARRSLREAPGGRLVDTAPPGLEFAPLATADPIDEGFRLNGMFRVTPDGGVFTDCLTGRNLHVLASAAEEQLERAWTDATPARDAALYASMVARFRGETRVLAEQFIGLKPGESCPSLPTPAAALRGTEWRVSEIGTEKLEVDARRLLPTITLDDEGRYTGSTGCNRVAGTYTLDADGLRFAPGLTTRMACAPPADTIEPRFLEALAATRLAQIAATTLDLSDAQGTRRLRLEARAR